MSAFPALSELSYDAPGGTERLRHRRYPVVFGGALLRADDSLPAGSYVELTMEWPFLWKGVHPLTLVMRGQVVRSEGKEVAVRTREHVLRVASVSSAAVTITAV